MRIIPKLGDVTPSNSLEDSPLCCAISTAFRTRTEQAFNRWGTYLEDAFSYGDDLYDIGTLMNAIRKRTLRRVELVVDAHLRQIFRGKATVTL